MTAEIARFCSTVNVQFFQKNVSLSIFININILMSSTFVLVSVIFLISSRRVVG